MNNAEIKNSCRSTMCIILELSIHLLECNRVGVVLHNLFIHPSYNMLNDSFQVNVLSPIYLRHQAHSIFWAMKPACLYPCRFCLTTYQRERRWDMDLHVVNWEFPRFLSQLNFHITCKLLSLKIFSSICLLVPNVNPKFEH